MAIDQRLSRPLRVLKVGRWIYLGISVLEIGNVTLQFSGGDEASAWIAVVLAVIFSAGTVTFFATFAKHKRLVVPVEDQKSECSVDKEKLCRG